MKCTTLLCIFAAITTAVHAKDLLNIWKTPEGNLNGCLRKSLQDRLRLIFISEEFVSADGFDFKLWNYTLTGLDDFEVLGMHSTEDYLFKVEAFFPYCQGIGSYTVKGHLFELNFDSAGGFTAYGTNLILHYAVKMNAVEQNGITSLKLGYQETKVTNPEGEVYVNLDNVHTGNLRKTVMMNRVLNEHNLELFDLLIPILEKHLTKLLDEVFEEQGITV